MSFENYTIPKYLTDITIPYNQRKYLLEGKWLIRIEKQNKPFYFWHAQLTCRNNVLKGRLVSGYDGDGQFQEVEGYCSVGKAKFTIDVDGESTPVELKVFQNMAESEDESVVVWPRD